jgi:large subunit ribosomal protein L25
MDVKISVTTGRTLGSRSARRLRTEGKIPAVVYGLHEESVPVSVDWTDLRRALTTDAGLNALITLDVDGDQQLSIIKDLQRDPVRRDVTHVDFIRIDREAEIQVEVPIVLEGHAEAVEREDGTVAHLMFNILVNSKPEAIPDELTVDVADMEIGDAVRVGDLDLPSGVSTDIDPEEVIVTAMVSRSTLEVAAEEEAAAAEELAEAEAEGAEGVEGEGEGEGDGGGDAGDDGGGEDEG